MNFFPLISIQFLLSLLLFVIASIITFYVPGRFVVIKLKENMQQSLAIPLSFVTGIVMWGFQGYIFGYLNVRFLAYCYIIFFLLAFLYKKPQIRNIKSIVFNQTRKNILLVSMIVIGLIVQLLPVIGSGLRYENGVRFYGINGTDGVMHLAYIEGIRNQMPPIEPGAYPAALKNYHYWVDLIIADFARVWHLPVSHLFFQFFPILISILTGLIGYKLVRIIGGNKTAALWFVFFLYFAGDGTYLLLLIFRQMINFQVPAIDNGAVMFLNMPNAMAKLIFLSSIILLHSWLITSRYRFGLLCVIFFAALVGTKIYYGIFAAFGFSLIVLFSFFLKFKLFSSLSAFKTLGFRKVKLIHVVSLYFIFAGLGAVIYLPANSASGGLGYYPLEWAKIFIGSEVLDWSDWWLRMQVYESTNNHKWIFILNAVAVIIAIVCIHGTRLFGFFVSKKSYKTLGIPLMLFFFPGLILFQILGLTTLQETGGYNVFNFFVVGTVVLSLILALSLSEIRLSKNIFKSVLVILIIAFTVPRICYEVINYSTIYAIPEGKYDLISNDELAALEAIRLKTPKNAVIQSHPENQFDKRTPYIAAVTARPSFLSGVSLQVTHNQKLGVREDELKQIFEADISSELAKRGKNKNITHFYLRKNEDEKLLFSVQENLLRKFYENDTILVLEIVPQK